MPLTMLQAEPDVARIFRWAQGHGLMPRQGEGDVGYALHALLCAVFGNLAPKPFLLQRDARRPPKLLAYSQQDETTLRLQAASFAEPAALAALGGLDRLAAKRMPDRFPAGHRLGFSVHLRPTVRQDRDGDRRKVREVDAFLAAIDGLPPEAGPSRGEVYRDWLARRLAPGATLEQVTLDAFQLVEAQRRDATRALRLRRATPEASFSGILRVTEPEAFAELLARGVGRHRAFGFGMLLLRPVR
ncbi:type I-E CRISPR-associated protein Cas6/Cse3/CasE [Siccirubricoccus sp. KC 17139]|uniref:Type I-E CRISPR-associated protein Cas6/Cse3/CasE n=1 Tax=Siccirubricoccus soli TaxID=2899147 RepID=A0ABT1D2A7_9PROT|nr:type I-E CRISPR-associated protein Cas6/Cse3/CasE [Siccirubricoccus soli]MCO6416037.1 type I-E CRISPR-associated protein Cas6/Cse3/CasE [Siccirubricoccus soli]MCP2682169.1 type I-E CRISPR-associated protein Cas6/Cse3/CasE [Siccirubricoccus soli]